MHLDELSADMILPTLMADFDSHKALNDLCEGTFYLCMQMTLLLEFAVQNRSSKYYSSLHCSPLPETASS